MKRRRRTITISELKSDHKLGARLARRKNGVDVIDDKTGRVVMTLWIPNVDLTSG